MFDSEEELVLQEALNDKKTTKILTILNKNNNLLNNLFYCKDLEKNLDILSWSLHNKDKDLKNYVIYNLDSFIRQEDYISENIFVLDAEDKANKTIIKKLGVQKQFNIVKRLTSNQELLRDEINILLKKGFSPNAFYNYVVKDIRENNLKELNHWKEIGFNFEVLSPNNDMFGLGMKDVINGFKLGEVALLSINHKNPEVTNFLIEQFSDKALTKAYNMINVLSDNDLVKQILIERLEPKIEMNMVVVKPKIKLKTR